MGLHTKNRRILTVSPQYAGQRLDNYLVRELKGIPKSLFYRLLRKGHIRINRSKVLPGYRLVQGDEIQLPILRQPVSGAPVVVHPLDIERISKCIVLETDDFWVVDKPPGLAVHGGSTLAYGLIDVLRQYYKNHPDFQDQGAIELVHRLDKNTSGCLLVAKNRAALLHLQDQMRVGLIRKTYLALVVGCWKSAHHQHVHTVQTIEYPLLTDVLQSGERMVMVDPRGKAAQTQILPVLPAWMTDQASLLKINLLTGRMHQIRVHLAYEGYPIVGDDKYGDRSINLEMRNRLACKRIFLHAVSLSFDFDGRAYTVEAPLAPDLKKVLTQLEIVYT
jgi:23S rRNA pseudouridine955/2504/2580 synthase